jgi:tetratricopeptide (TPR) repeat protein/3',5'-cyclic AMP phosphodiesterase CpdA
MSGLTWIHISDWHQKSGEFDRQVVRAALIRDIRDRIAINPDLDKIDFLIFSGDVAFSGKAEEYLDAKRELFDPLLKACGLSPEMLFIVPGNHDLDLDEIEMLPSELSKPLTSDADVQRWLMDDRRRSRLLEPFHAFASFVKDYTGQEQPDYANIRRWQIGDKNVAILGLNSALMCGRNRNTDGKINDNGFLLVGEPQIQSSLEKIEGADLKIAVLHHPFDWLDEFDYHSIKRLLRQKFNFILHGHAHKPGASAILGNLGYYITIPAGACHDRSPSNSAYTYSYNYVHLDFDNAKGTVFLRRWSDPRVIWIEDTDSAAGGRFEFILIGSAPSTSSHSLKSVRPSTQLIPNQIPPPPRDFKGREEEIMNILSNFEKGATITGMRGMGGIGKTALALVLADKIKEQFPDGQIFIDMRGTSNSPELPPLTPDEAMAQVIRAYNPVDRLPENSNELRGLYLSILAGKRVLLLLDDAAGSEQVEPLLPSASSYVLITSRLKLSLPGLAEEDLDIMTPSKARELLLEIAPRIGNRADELAKLCGYLPLALRNAARALAEKRDLSVPEYERLLKHKVALSKLVKGSFSLSYDLLTYGRKKQWRRLSVFPEDFDCSAASAVLKMAPGPSAEALSDLVRWGLVDFTATPDSEDGRYRLHDLARLFAESCLERDELANAQQKHAKYYSRVISQAGVLYEKGGANILQGLKLFDREWVNIKAGQTWAGTAIRSYRKFNKSDLKFLIQITSSYANDCIDILDLRLHPKEIIKFLEAGLTAASIGGDRRAEGVHLGNIGNAYAELGAIGKAIEYHEQALAISNEIGDRLGEGALLGNLGNAYVRLGEMRKAIEYYEQALGISREIGDRWGEGALLGSLGNAYAGLGATRKAIEYNEQALAISRKIEDRRGERKRLGNLGIIYADLGETGKAIEYYDQALKIAREIGDKRGEWGAMGNLGIAYAARGETSKAIEYYDQALKIAREIGDKRGEWVGLRNLGEAYAALRETSKAIEYYDQALKIAHEIGDKGGEGDCLNNLGETYVALSETKTAIEYYDQALKIAREISDKRDEGGCLNNLGMAYSELGETQRAIECYEEALAIAEEIENKKAESTTLNNFGDLYSKLSDTQKSIECYEQSVAIAREIGNKRVEVIVLGNLGGAYSKLGETQKTVEYNEQALFIAKDTGNKKAERAALNNLGDAYSELGKTQKAIEYYGEALVIARNIGDIQCEGNYLSNLGSIFFNLGETQKALDYYEQSLAINREIGDSLNEANVLWNIGLIMEKRGDEIKAISSVGRAHRIFSDINSSFAAHVNDWLLKQFASTDGQVRKAVVETLACSVLSDKHVYEHILLALKDKDNNTRYAAVNALSSLVPGDRNVIVSIMEMLNDSDLSIQQAAAAALGKVAQDDKDVQRELSSFWARTAPNDLEIKTRKFFEAAGFNISPLNEPGSFKCIPSKERWNGCVKLDNSMYMRCLPGIVLNQDIVVELKKAAQDQAESKKIFVVVDKQPSRSGLIAIGALRSEGIQAIIIGDAVIQRGLEEQKEHGKLEDHLSLHLGNKRNYYNVRDPVTDQLTFFGREDYTNYLLDSLSQGKPIALFGLRKMGKSSVLQYLRDKAEFPVAYVDLSAGRELSDLFDRILKSWQHALRFKMPDLNWNPPSLQSNPATEFAKATRELMGLLEVKMHSPKLGLFVDEIELIAPKISVDSQVFNSNTLDRYLIFTQTLRGLVQETKAISLIIAGVDPRIIRSNRFEGEQNPFYQLFIEEYLGPLSRDDCIQMIRDIGCQMDLEYSDDAAEFIADTSGRHPFVARQLCSSIVEMIRQDERIQPDTSENIQIITLDIATSIIESFISDPTTASYLNENGLWGEISNPKLWPLIQIKENKSILTTLARDDFLPETVILKNGFDREACEDSVFELKKRAVLDKNKLNNSLRIQMNLFQNWIKRYKLQGN